MDFIENLAEMILPFNGNTLIASTEGITILKDEYDSLLVFAHLKGFVNPYCKLDGQGKPTEDVLQWTPNAVTECTNNVFLYTYCEWGDIHKVIKKIGLQERPFVTRDSNGIGYDVVKDD